MLTITLTLPRSLLTSSTTPVEAAERAVHRLARGRRRGTTRSARASTWSASIWPEDAPHLVLLEGDGASGPEPMKPRHAGHVLHQVARLVVQVHLDHHVGREGLALGDLALAVLHLDEVLRRDQDLAELLLERRRSGSPSRGSSSPCSRGPNRCGPRTTSCSCAFPILGTAARPAHRRAGAPAPVERPSGTSTAHDCRMSPRPP